MSDIISKKNLEMAKFLSKPTTIKANIHYINSVLAPSSHI